jgi:hypothetical protein
LWPSTFQIAVEPLRSSVISPRAQPGEVVVEVFVGRLDHVVERLGRPARSHAHLLVYREDAGGGAVDGEHALARLGVEDSEGRHPPAAVGRLPADVLDRHVDGKRRRSIRRQLEPPGRETRYLALWVSEKRGIVTRTSPSLTAGSALGPSARCSPPIESGSRAGLQAAASRRGPGSSS